MTTHIKTLTAILLYTTGITIQTGLGVLIKKLFVSYNIPVPQLVAMRTGVLMILLLPFMIKDRKTLFTKTMFISNMKTDFFYVLATYTWYFGLSIAPYNDAIIISFGIPVVTAILSKFVLKESVKKETWIGLSLCIASAIIVTTAKRPINEATSRLHMIGYLIVLINVFVRGSGNILRKRLLKNQSAVHVTYYHLIFLSPVAIISVLSMKLVPVSTTAWILITVAASAYFIENYLMCKAYSLCKISILQPFDFFRIVSSVIISYLVLQEKFLKTQIIGASLILLSQFFMLYFSIKNKNKNS